VLSLASYRMSRYSTDGIEAVLEKRRGCGRNRRRGEMVQRYERKKNPLLGSLRSELTCAFGHLMTRFSSSALFALLSGGPRVQRPQALPLKNQIVPREPIQKKIYKSEQSDVTVCETADPIIQGISKSRRSLF